MKQIIGYALIAPAFIMFVGMFGYCIVQVYRSSDKWMKVVLGLILLSAVLEIIGFKIMQ